ncbi:MAG: response regulator [Simkaniaceae bacterium]|nr:response regulator [Simkaniaceae bacterium]
MKKILLVDDSQTALTFMSALLKSKGYEVHAFSAPQEALDAISKINPQLVVVDIVMPKMNGFEMIKRLSTTSHIPTIVVSSLYTDEDKYKATQAYEVGALAILEKPLGNDARAEKLREQFLKIVAAVFEDIERKPQIQNGSSKGSKEGSYELLAIGASLGGPNALHAILTQLSTPFPLPILILQHVGEGYDRILVEWLAKSSKMSIELAQDGATLEKGRCYLSPAGKNLTVSKSKKIQLTEIEKVGLATPNINSSFESLAQSLQNKCLAVLLTGMGSDGARGLKKLQEAGSYTIAQAEEGCLMFSMPAEAIKLGAAQAIHPLHQIAEEISKLVG